MVGRAQTSLPFTMILTHIFKHYGVRIQGEQSMKLGRGSKINEGALHRMHWFKTDMVSGLERMKAENMLRRIF